MDRSAAIFHERRTRFHDVESALVRRSIQTSREEKRFLIMKLNS
jgi:hypothetical protein